MNNYTIKENKMKKPTMLLLFQHRVDWEREPEHTIGIQPGNGYSHEFNPQEHTVDDFILPPEYYAKILTWASLVSYETHVHGNGRHDFNINPAHFDGAFQLLTSFRQR